ncbi:MAG: hypothetical protein ACP5IE_05705 [Infirmifilum sp.]
MQEDYSVILRKPRVEKELEDFEEWFKRYGEYILTYEESKLVVRVAWVARIMLDEGYAAFPGHEKEVKTFVADFLSQRLASLGVDTLLVSKGELHGTRDDVVEVVTRIFPNVQQMERPSLPRIIKEDEFSRRRAQGFHRVQIAYEFSRIRPLIALATTILLASLMIILLSH